MNISQAAAQTGLSAKQIRNYEKQGLLPPAPRSEAGYRRFLPVDLQRLRFIAHAREVGFSLAQIKRLLALADDPERHSRDVKQLTSEHIAELNQKIATLQPCATRCKHGTTNARATMLRRVVFWKG